ncbi:hypothetical protein [Clostridium sp. FP1]|uniref:hypothetical protein n=1 Tax=Clostridium sp. FP1 TaxID=2724076 RepID=UPI0013E92689|nr:hypothetical protein [Clostridium sp. FP1]MBZ9636622.1 hypothetical protein [Clostridium sp. FP1]
MNKKFVTGYITILLLIYPIMQQYSTVIENVSLAEILLLAVFPFIVFDIIRGKFKLSRKVLCALTPYLFYILIQLFIIHFTESDEYIIGISIRTLHYVFYIVSTIALIKCYFDARLGYKVFKIVSVFSTLYIIIQTLLLRTSGFYLTGKIPFLNLMSEDVLYFIQHASYSQYYVRPRSVFPEPSSYAIYIVFFLIITLFSNYHLEKTYYLELFLTFGIILSMSSTGIILMLIIWTSYLVWMITNNKVSKKFIRLLIILLPIILFVFFKFGFYEYFIERTMSENGSFGESTSLRVGTYQNVFNGENLFTQQGLFGVGMRSYEYMEGYLSALPRLFYYYGIIGSIIFFIGYSILLKKTNFTQKMMWIIILVSCIGSDSIFSSNILFCFPFLIVKLNNLPIQFKGEKYKR